MGWDGGDSGGMGMAEEAGVAEHSISIHFRLIVGQLFEDRICCNRSKLLPSQVGPIWEMI